MRLRKKDWSSEVFEQFSDYLISDFEAIKGNWKETLKTDKLHVEIGAEKGITGTKCRPYTLNAE
ncbi:hypothetical protein MGH68_12990 [Erysipelothrix sp. D19-032]